MRHDYDVIVLGAGDPREHRAGARRGGRVPGGPGGGEGAGALGEGGRRVAGGERELVGGECSYWACIPSKTLLRPGEAVHGALEAAGRAEVDVEAALAYRDYMVSNHTDDGAIRWLEDRGIALLRGTGRLRGTGVVEVDGM